eukprot:350916-Chlamydomonas_euryale.AAC.4
MHVATCRVAHPYTACMLQQRCCILQRCAGLNALMYAPVQSPMQTASAGIPGPLGGKVTADEEGMLNISDERLGGRVEKLIKAVKVSSLPPPLPRLIGPAAVAVAKQCFKSLV